MLEEMGFSRKDSEIALAEADGDARLASARLASCENNKCSCV